MFSDTREAREVIALPRWVNLWVSLSALAIAAFLSAPPITLLLLAATRDNPTAAATIFSALVGFGGVALTTRAGFRNLAASQQAQSERERQAREDQREHAERIKADERAYEKTIVAAALHGELVALLPQVHNGMNWLRTQKALWTAMAKDRAMSDVPVDISLPSFSVPIFKAQISKLGLFGPSLAGDLVTVYSRAMTNAPLLDQKPKLKPVLAAKLVSAIHDGLRDWSEEIVHVGARLSHVQGIMKDDPGPLHAMKMKKIKLANAGHDGSQHNE